MIITFALVYAVIGLYFFVDTYIVMSMRLASHPVVQESVEARGRPVTIALVFGIKVGASMMTAMLWPISLLPSKDPS